MNFRNPSQAVLLVAAAVWLTAVGFGLSSVWTYENTPGAIGPAPSHWPRDSAIKRAPYTPTLLLFIHPHCPCSRATMGELAILMAHSQGLVNVQAIFVKPAGREEWEKTDLWHSAADIPGVQSSVDEGGVEAKLFRSKTSGSVLLYSSTGQLLFSGGITGSRGHAGDNDGRSAIQSILATGGAAKNETPVFGCPLMSDADDRSKESCNELHRN